LNKHRKTYSFANVKLLGAIFSAIFSVKMVFNICQL